MSLKDRLESKKSFSVEGQTNELKRNHEILIVDDSDKHFVNITLEPNMLERLSSECRLTLEEYVDAIERFIEMERVDWKELRMKDMINLQRDEIIKDTMLKYAKEHHNIDRESFNGIEISYSKRYNNEGYIGEAITLSMNKL